MIAKELVEKIVEVEALRKQCAELQKRIDWLKGQLAANMGKGELRVIRVEHQALVIRNEEHLTFQVVPLEELCE